MAASDTILGRRANRRAFDTGQPFTVSAYRRGVCCAYLLSRPGLRSRFGYCGSVRFTDPGNLTPGYRESVGYRIRVIPKNRRR